MANTQDTTVESVVARFKKPNVQAQTEIAVVADPHLSTQEEPDHLHGTEDGLLRAVADAESRDVDAIVSTGDLTMDGDPWDVDRFNEILESLETEFISVPGNHDVPKASSEEFEYGDDHTTPGLDQFVERYTPGELPFVTEIGGLEIIGLNTASMSDGSLRDTHDGQLSPEQVNKLTDLISTEDNQIILMHHNLPAMYDVLRNHRDSFYPDMDLPPVMRDSPKFVEFLSEYEVPLVVTGHLHMIATSQMENTREITCPSTGTFPRAYLLFEFDSGGTVVKYVPVDDVSSMGEAHHSRGTQNATSKGITAISSTRLASMPLIDDWKEGER